MLTQLIVILNSRSASKSVANILLPPPPGAEPIVSRPIPNKGFKFQITAITKES